MAKKDNGTNRKFEDMKKAELIELCKKFDLFVPKNTTKLQLISILTGGSGTQKASASAAKKPDEEAAAKKAPKDSSSERGGEKLSGREKARREQLKIREEKLKDAKKLYEDDYEKVMHSMDRITPKVYRNRPEYHTVNPEDAWQRKDILTDEDRALAQSKDDALFTLTGTIEGAGNTEYVEMNGRTVPFVFVIVDFEGRTVRIPTYHFWQDFDDEKKYPPTKLYSIIQHRIGSEVDFNVLDIDDTGKDRYFGTRLLAMKRKRVDVWYGKMTDGSWYVREGDIIEARVVETGKRYAILEAGGAETTIYTKDVSHNYVQDIEEVILPGDRVKVKVSGIVREPLPRDTESFTFPVSFRASIKDAEPDPQILYFNDFDRGDTRRAIVTNIDTDISNDNESNAYYCVMMNKPVTVRCRLVKGAGESGHLPRLGDEVRVRVTDKNADRHFIYGEIVRVITKRSKNEIAFTVQKR